MSPATFRDLQRLAKAAARADIDWGFRFLDLLQPVLVLHLIDTVRAKAPGSEQEPQLAGIAALAQASVGKRLASDEGIAFCEACTPALILNWCRFVGAAT